MNSVNLKFALGVLCGAGAGFAGGYFVCKSITKHQFELLEQQHDENLRNAQAYYEDRFEREVENRAKDMLMKAAESHSKAIPTASEPADDSSDDRDEPAQEDPENGPSEPSVEPRKRPESVLVNQNVFDRAEQDPSMAVDYTKYTQEKESQVVVGQNLLRDDRTALSGAKDGRDARVDIRKAIKDKDAEDDLREWMESHDAKGYPVDNDDDEDSDSEAVGTEDPALEYSLAKARSGDLGAEIIDDQEYENRKSFTKSFVMYCELDDTWCDEDLNKIEDPRVVYGNIVGDVVPDVAGLFALGAQTSGEPERFYIRNTKVGTDYECMRYHRAYYGDICDNPLMTK